MSVTKKFDVGTNDYAEIWNTVSGSAVLAGDFVSLGNLVGFYFEAAAVGDVAAVVVEARRVRAKKITGALAIGVPLYWDADADPLGGTTGSGAVTSVATGNTLVGFVQKAALSTDTEVQMIFDGDLAFARASQIALLTDVDVSTPPTNGQVLKFVSGTGKWTPAADAT